MILLFYLFVCTLFVGGLVVIGEAWRRRPDHPACRGCGYNLTGRVRSGGQCPECGVILSARNIVPPREMRLNAAQLAIGIGMIILSFPICCLGTFLWA